MLEQIRQHRKRAPSALVFMARALRPSPGLSRDGGFPPLVQRWSGLRIAPGHLAAFQRATGLAVEDGVSLLYPHVLGFRLQMAVLTHPAFPLPIWTALQIRNRLVQHRRLDRDASFDLETRVGAHRLLDKGVEVDLLSGCRADRRAAGKARSPISIAAASTASGPRRHQRRRRICRRRQSSIDSLCPRAAAGRLGA
jgi:hypothetical protein